MKHRDTEGTESNRYPTMATLLAINAQERESVIAFHQAKARLLMQGEASLTPNLLVMDEHRALSMNLLYVDFRTHQQKTATMFALGQRYYREHVVPALVSFASEAWSSHAVDGVRRYLLPEDDPQRKEIAIVFTAAFCDPQTVSVSTLDLQREPDNTIRAEGDWRRSEADRVVSPLLMTFFRGFFSDVAHKMSTPND